MTYQDKKDVSALYEIMNIYIKFAMDNIEMDYTRATEFLWEAHKTQIELEKMAADLGIAYDRLIGLIS